MPIRFAALCLALASVGATEQTAGRAILPPAQAPVAAFVESRNLLLARRHAELTTLIEKKQGATGQDPAKADELDWTLGPFRLDDAAVPGLIEEWLRAGTSSWAPLLARAVNEGARAGRARGTRWASDTSDDQFRRMGELLAQMRADCRRVLSLNPVVCRCHVELVMAAKQDGFEAKAVAESAFLACPQDYALNVEHVFGLTPRWGGSYEAMRAAVASARRRGVDEFHARSLEAYVPADRASLLVIAGKRDQALAVLDEAIRESPTPMLYQERGWLQYRRGDAARALSDADAALELSNGGWIFSPSRLTRLLVVRAWALHSLGRVDESKADLGLALQLAPSDTSVLRLRNQILK